jgi:hypothetical protein
MSWRLSFPRQAPSTFSFLFLIHRHAMPATICKRFLKEGLCRPFSRQSRLALLACIAGLSVTVLLISSFLSGSPAAAGSHVSTLSDLEKLGQEIFSRPTYR